MSLQHMSVFQYAGCVRAWARQAPWYALCLSRVRRVLRVRSMCLCFNMLAVHEHGQGTHLGTCLVCTACVVAIVVCVCVVVVVVGIITCTTVQTRLFLATVGYVEPP